MPDNTPCAAEDEWSLTEHVCTGGSTCRATAPPAVPAAAAPTAAPVAAPGGNATPPGAPTAPPTAAPSAPSAPPAPGQLLPSAPPSAAPSGSPQSAPVVRRRPRVLQSPTAAPYTPGLPSAPPAQPSASPSQPPAVPPAAGPPQPSAAPTTPPSRPPAPAALSQPTAAPSAAGPAPPTAPAEAAPGGACKPACEGRIAIALPTVTVYGAAGKVTRHYDALDLVPPRADGGPLPKDTDPCEGTLSPLKAEKHLWDWDFGAGAPISLVVVELDFPSSVPESQRPTEWKLEGWPEHVASIPAGGSRYVELFRYPNGSVPSNSPEEPANSSAAPASISISLNASYANLRFSVVQVRGDPGTCTKFPILLVLAAAAAGFLGLVALCITCCVLHGGGAAVRAACCGRTGAECVRHAPKPAPDDVPWMGTEEQVKKKVKDHFAMFKFQWERTKGYVCDEAAAALHPAGEHDAAQLLGEHTEESWFEAAQREPWLQDFTTVALELLRRYTHEAQDTDRIMKWPSAPPPYVYSAKANAEEHKRSADAWQKYKKTCDDACGRPAYNEALYAAVHSGMKSAVNSDGNWKGLSKFVKQSALLVALAADASIERKPQKESKKKLQAKSKSKDDAGEVLEWVRLMSFSDDTKKRLGDLKPGDCFAWSAAVASVTTEQQVTADYLNGGAEKCVLMRIRAPVEDARALRLGAASMYSAEGELLVAQGTMFKVRRLSRPLFTARHVLPTKAAPMKLGQTFECGRGRRLLVIEADWHLCPLQWCDAAKKLCDAAMQDATDAEEVFGTPEGRRPARRAAGSPRAVAEDSASDSGDEALGEPGSPGSALPVNFSPRERLQATEAAPGDKGRRDHRLDGEARCRALVGPKVRLDFFKDHPVPAALWSHLHKDAQARLGLDEGVARSRADAARSGKLVARRRTDPVDILPIQKPLLDSPLLPKYGLHTSRRETGPTMLFAPGDVLERGSTTVSTAFGLAPRGAPNFRGPLGGSVTTGRQSQPSSPGQTPGLGSVPLLRSLPDGARPK